MHAAHWTHVNGSAKVFTHTLMLWNDFSARGTISSLSTDLCLSKVKCSVCFQVLVRDLGAPTDTQPDHQAEPQDITLHMTYRKGSQPDFSMICMSVFFFFFFLFFLGVCYNWWKSIRGCFPIMLYCTVVPAVWASPSESSGGAVWFSGLGVQTQCFLSLSLSLGLSLSYSLHHKASWEGGLYSTLVARYAPLNNTCNTDEFEVRVGWVGHYNIAYPGTPQSNVGPPGQMPTTR